MGFFGSKRLQAVFFSAFAGVGSACGGAATDADLLLDEGASFIGAAESDSDADQLGVMTTNEAETLASAQSQDADAKDAEAREPCDFESKRKRVQQVYDENGDGVLDEDERARLREDLAERRENASGYRKLIHKKRRNKSRRVRWAFDANSDGVLDEDERAELVEAMQARCLERRANILEEFDANNDGELDENEREAAKEARRARHQEKREEILETYDSNGDGRLDREERQALKGDLVDRYEDRRNLIKAEFDANQDGELDEDEIAALKAAIRDRIANTDTDSSEG